MLSISYLFEKSGRFDGFGNFEDYARISSKVNAVEASKKMKVKKDLYVNPIPSSNRLQIKNQKPIKAKITVRMGVIDQEN